MSFATVIYQTEQSRAIAFTGVAGTNPRGIGEVLSNYDVDFQSYSSLKTLSRDFKDGDAAIIMIWNDKEKIAKGAHFFTAIKEDGVITAFNQNHDGVEPISVLSDLFPEGDYIYGYIVSPKKEE